MRTGEFRGAGAFAAEWVLADGRQDAPDVRPQTRWLDHAAAGEMLELSETGVDGAWLRIDEPVVAPDTVRPVEAERAGEL